MEMEQCSIKMGINTQVNGWMANVKEKVFHKSRWLIFLLAKYFYVNGDEFEGTYVNGFKEGNGVYMSAQGSRYEGDFKLGKRSGQGFYQFKNGD